MRNTRRELGKLANLWLLCAAAADYLDRQKQGQLGHKPMAPSDIKDVTTTLFIGMSQRGSYFQDAMPVGVLDVAPKKL
jgi:hypothetical protein